MNERKTRRSNSREERESVCEETGEGILRETLKGGSESDDNGRFECEGRRQFCLAHTECLERMKGERIGWTRVCRRKEGKRE